MKLDRRNFLKQTGKGLVALALGKFFFNELMDLKDNYYENLIYNELSKHVHYATHNGFFMEDGEPYPTKRGGMGIILNGYYITMNHITDIGKVRKETAFGNYSKRYKIFDYTAKLYNHTIDKVIFDELYDIAIFDARHLGLQDFPCKLSDKIEIRDEVFLIGQPGLDGLNIRKGEITDLNGLQSEDNRECLFGTDINVMGGDSGCPLVSSDYKLLGLTNYQYEGLSYYSRIGNLL